MEVVIKLPPAEIEDIIMKAADFGYCVKEGDYCKEGDPLIYFSGCPPDTIIGNVFAKQSGTVKKLLVNDSEIIKVGQPILIFDTEKLPIDLLMEETLERKVKVTGDGFYSLSIY